MRGVYVGRGEDGKAIYVEANAGEGWVGKGWRTSHQRFVWPPRTIRRAISAAQRAERGTRRHRRAVNRVLRQTRRYGLRVTVDG